MNLKPVSYTHLLQTSVNDKDNYVIFLSDGDSADTPRSADVDYVKNKAKVYTIGIGGAVASQLIPLATSRDNYYSYDDVSDSDSLNGLYKIFDDIITDITVEIGAGEENASGTTAKMCIRDRYWDKECNYFW